MKILKLLLICTGLWSISSCGDTANGDPAPELPKVTISNVTQFEGDTDDEFRFKVSTNIAPPVDITLAYESKEITAGEGIDFFPVKGTLTISAGQREGIITVGIKADTLKELDEQFKIQLSNPVNATLIATEAIGTIRDDDDYLYIPPEGYITPESYTGYMLSWQDEFNGTEINTEDWTHETGAGGWGNEELQTYTDRAENSYLSDGKLIIEAKKESSGYSSARMITQDKQTFHYGRIDIRAILPEGQGIWPALWMLGSNISTIGWPACGEIDIMELVGHEPSSVHGTIHWGPQGQGFSNNTGSAFSLPNGEKFSGKFHVFTIIWEPYSIKWYVDDHEYSSITIASVNGSYPFNEDFFFIFNIAVGGQWPGYPDGSTVFPQRMTVDYIRVFQKQ